MASSSAHRAEGEFLDVEERFAIVPEWLLDADVSDCAVRLYAVLLRYGQSLGARMPSRATLARRLHKKSTDTVDRTMRDLVDLGAVVVQARYAGRERPTNLYRVRTSRPTTSGGGTPPQSTPTSGPTPGPVQAGSRKSAATPDYAVGRIVAADPVAAVGPGRTNAVTVAAAVRHDRKFSTESKPPPSVDDRSAPAIAGECSIGDWSKFVGDCLARRRAAAQPTARWSAPCLDAALQLAVSTRQWPAASAAKALLLVAADPSSRSPKRVAEAARGGTAPRLLSSGQRRN